MVVIGLMETCPAGYTMVERGEMGKGRGLWKYWGDEQIVTCRKEC